MLLATLAVAALFLVLYAFAFGFTRLLLRRTSWAEYSLEAPWLTTTALVILILSVLGYRDPHELPAWQPWTLLLIGLGLSFFVAVWDRAELLDLVHRRWQHCLVVTLPAGLAALTLLALFPGNVWDDIHIPWIAEYIEYATLASVLTGHHHGEAGTLVMPFCVDHHKLRIGQDILIASVAQVTGLHPIQTIIPLAAFLRFQQAVLMGLLLCGMAGNTKLWKVIVAVLVLDAILLTEALIFSSSFFSSNCTTPLYALYFVWLALLRQFGWRECVVVVLMNLFFFLTYPEFLIVAKAFEAFCLALAWWRGARRTWIPLALCNVFVFAMHPLAIINKVQTLRAHLNYPGGWNVLGDPIAQTSHFVYSLIGLRYGLAAIDPLRRAHWFGWIVVVAAVLLIACGLVAMARRYRITLPLLAWLGLVLATHAGSYNRYGNFYAGFKTISHTYFVLMLAAAAPLLLTQSRWLRRLSASALTVWIVAACIATPRLVREIRHEGYAVNYSKLRDTLVSQFAGRDFAVIGQHSHSLRLVNLAVGESGGRIAALDKTQHYVVHERGLSGMVDCRATPPNAIVFEGVLISESAILKNGTVTLDDRMLSLEAGDVLFRTGNLVLCEGRVSVSSGLEFPKYHWIRDDCASTPGLFALSRQLRLKGEISQYHALPYRFTCYVRELGWSAEVVVDETGSFERVLVLPESVVGRNIAVEFGGYGTFRPAECMPGSADSRDLGFMLTSVRFDKMSN